MKFCKFCIFYIQITALNKVVLHLDHKEHRLFLLGNLSALLFTKVFCLWFHFLRSIQSLLKFFCKTKNWVQSQVQTYDYGAEIMEHSWVFVHSSTRLNGFQTVRHLETLNRGKKRYIHTLHTHTASDGLGYTLHVNTASGGKWYPACPNCWRWKTIHPARSYCWQSKGILTDCPYWWQWKGLHHVGSYCWCLCWWKEYPLHV